MGQHLRCLLLVLAVTCGVVLGFTFAFIAPEPRTGEQLELLSKSRPLPDFTLQSAGGTVDRRLLSAGKWHLLVFGYTHCPDVCPTTLVELAQLLEVIEGVPVDVLFVSVDPRRDSPVDLENYVTFFSPSMIGATGDPANLSSLAAALGVRFEVRENGGEGAAGVPTVAHTNIIALVDGRGRFRGRLRPGFDLEAVSREIRALVGASG